MAPSVPRLVRTLTLRPNERLFEGLDGRDLLVKGSAWRLMVYAVCEEAGRRWVQIAIDGPQHYMLTLALATRSGVQQAVDVLSRWLEQDPIEAHQVLVVG